MALASAGLPAGAAGVADMVAFDAAYLPALAQAHAEWQGSPEFGIRAAFPVMYLQSRWPRLRTALQADAAPHWDNTLNLVHSQIQAAGAAAQRRDPAAAHAALEPVRHAMREARLRDGLDYLPDHLTVFDAELQRLASAGAAPGPFSAAQRAALSQQLARALALWHEVERRPPDATLFQLAPSQMARWTGAVIDLKAALAALSAALERADDDALRGAAAALRPPLWRALAAFGEPLFSR